MRYYDSIEKIRQNTPTAVTLGKFDGFHRGHQKLLNVLNEKAALSGYEKALFTFDVPPQVSLGDMDHRLIATHSEKRELVRRNGIDIMVECVFDDRLRNMEAETFIEEVLIKKLKAKIIVSGEDFHFGKNRKGSAAFLLERGKDYGLDVVVLEKEMDKEREISSTYVREMILDGNIEKANALLGYRYFVTGIVVKDTRIGHTIGFPTINIIPEKEKLLPPRGVYASFTEVQGKTYASVTNIGIKPTVHGRRTGVETHLLDFDEDLYGKEVTVMLEHFQRPEQKFESVEALKVQLQKDITKRRSLL